MIDSCVLPRLWRAEDTGLGEGSPKATHDLRRHRGRGEPPVGRSHSHMPQCTRARGVWASSQGVWVRLSS